MGQLERGERQNVSDASGWVSNSKFPDMTCPAHYDFDFNNADASEPAVGTLAAMAYRDKREDQIAGTGYAVASLEAALWCFNRSDSFEGAVLKAANLGDDADTTAAIVGQIAGAFYGMEGIPARWLQRLWMKDSIVAIAETLYGRAVARGAGTAPVDSSDLGAAV